MKLILKNKLLSALVFSFILLQFNVFADLNDTVRHAIPTEYYSRCENSGTTQLFKYISNGRARTAVIYLPFGYDENNKDTKYPVLYLMHGGGGSSTSYMGVPGAPNQLCWIIDNAIKNGEIQPLIIVCPNDNGSFYGELRKVLIPEIDDKFNTIPDREHRAFGGFSMGSVATWNVFAHDLDIIKNYIPMSGDSWICGSTGGKNFPEQTAIALSKVSFIDEFKDDFQIFAATGTGDTAYPNLSPQIAAMKNLPETFGYTTEDFSNGNLIYYVVQGFVHSYNHTYEYLYNALKLFF